MFWMLCTFLQNIGIQAALAHKLTSSQVGVVWWGDEVTCERLVHVLVDIIVVLVEHAALFGLYVPEKSFKRHGSVVFGWRKMKNNGSS